MASAPLDSRTIHAVQQLAAALPSLEPGAGAAARLQALLRVAGLRARRVRLRDGWWERGMLPLVAFHSREGRTLALLPNQEGHYYACAPGERIPPPLTASEAANLEPWAYCLYPQPHPEGAGRWRDLPSLVRLAGGELRRALLVGGVIALLGLALPLAARLSLGVDATSRTFLAILVGIAIAALASTAFQLSRALLLLRAELRVGLLAQTLLWERLLSLPVAFFRGITPGELTSRLEGLTTARTLLVPALVSLTLNGLIALAALGLLLLAEWRVGLLALAATLVLGLLAALLLGRAVRAYRTLAMRQHSLLGATVGLVSGIAKLRVARAQERAFAFWEEVFGALRSAATQAARERRSVMALQAAIVPVAFIGSFTALALGGWRSSGELLALTVTTGILAAALTAMWGDLLAVARALPPLDHLQPVLKSAPEVLRPGRAPGDLSGAVELHDVHFSYSEGQRPALGGVSIRVAPGSFVAVVGPSGSGKSTLVRLLLGFDAPQRGRICYDGQPLDELDLHAVRRQVGVVLQHATLTPGTIRSNILGAAPLNEEEAWLAAELAGISPDIQALPMRMNTIITESGGAFSGGQRQRLLLARALARQPRLLILDEATSALDQRIQAAIMKRIAALNITRLVIAHRLSTVRQADWIYVLDGGRVTQEGTYDELIATPGLFQALAQRQLLTHEVP